MKNKYLIIIVLAVNIFGITIPYLYKNHQLSNHIKVSQNNITDIHKENEDVLNERDYYDLIRILNDKTISHALNNISTHISLIDHMTYTVSFSGEKEQLRNYILFLETMDNDLILNEAMLNFNDGQESNMTLISR